MQSKIASGTEPGPMNLKTPPSYGVAMLAVAVGWVVFAWPWLSGEVTTPYDAKAHFQPQLQFLANALHTGQSPFWTHNVFAGSPQIADPQSLIFSPAILLAYFNAAPTFRELDIFCFLLLGLVAFSVLMIFKDRGWHPAGAAVAALATAFGGSSIWRIQHIKQIEAFAFFVLCLWLLARALDQKSPLYGMLAGFAACFMVIEPGQVAMLGCYILAGYTLNHWLSAPRFWTAARQSILPLLSGGLVVGTLATIPIVLTFLFVEASNRPEIPFEEAARGALHPASLLTAIVPDLYSAHSNLPYWGPASSDWRANWLALNENMGQLYIGALPIILLLVVGLMKTRLWVKEIRFFTIAIAVLLIYALGRYTFLFPFIYHYIPGVDLFRRPADATYALGAMAAIASGYLLHRMLSVGEAPTNLQRRAAFIILGGLFAASAAVAAAHHHFYRALIPVLLSIGLFMGGWLALLFARLYASRYGALTIAGLAAFMTADLAINNGPCRSTGKPPSEYEILRVDTHNETIAFLKAHLKEPAESNRRDRIELTGLGFEWPNASLVHNFDHVLGYNPLRLSGIHDAWGAEENIAEARQRKFTPLFPSYRSLMADFLGLRYIATSQPIEKIDKKLKPGDLTLLTIAGDGHYIYENPSALPRVLFATDWLPVSFEQLLKDGRWPSFDPKRTVLLQSLPPQTTPMEIPLQSQQAPEVHLKIYRNTEVQIEVDTPRSGFVILNDVWHPWWFGSVDSRPVPILRANVIFRAIQVPAGKHVVRFEFKPVSGAAREIAALIKGEPLEPPPIAPAEFPARPEANRQALQMTAQATPQKLR